MHRVFVNERGVFVVCLSAGESMEQSGISFTSTRLRLLRWPPIEDSTPLPLREDPGVVLDDQWDDRDLSFVTGYFDLDGDATYIVINREWTSDRLVQSRYHLDKPLSAGGTYVFESQGLLTYQRSIRGVVTGRPIYYSDCGEGTFFGDDCTCTTPPPRVSIQPRCEKAEWYVPGPLEELPGVWLFPLLVFPDKMQARLRLTSGSLCKGISCCRRGLYG